MKRADLCALVLAGGRSRRMGHDKADIVLDGPGEGETLLARTVRVALEVASECVVVLAPNQVAPQLDARARLVRDLLHHEGPIAALAHALDDVRSSWVLVLATDHPRLSAVVLSRLVALANNAGAALDGQPFLSVYDADVLRSALTQMTLDGERRARVLLDRTSVRRVTAEDLLADAAVRQADPTLASLLDVDTPEELAAFVRS